MIKCGESYNQYLRRLHSDKGRIAKALNKDTNKSNNSSLSSVVKEMLKEESMPKVRTVNIPSSQIESFRQLVIIEMQKMGATNDELSLICDNMIFNAVLSNRQPKDVAWAILQ